MSVQSTLLPPRCTQSGGLSPLLFSPLKACNKAWSLYHHLFAIPCEAFKSLPPPKEPPRLVTPTPVKVQRRNRVCGHRPAQPQWTPLRLEVRSTSLPRPLHLCLFQVRSRDLWRDGEDYSSDVASDYLVTWMTSWSCSGLQCQVVRKLYEEQEMWSNSMSTSPSAVSVLRSSLGRRRRRRQGTNVEGLGRLSQHAVVEERIY